MPAAGLAMRELISVQANGTLSRLGDRARYDGTAAAQRLADLYRDAGVTQSTGRFSAKIGSEWSSVPGGNNLHRNVFYLEAKQVAYFTWPLLPGRITSLSTERNAHDPA
jgi:hypothetical protein